MEWGRYSVAEGIWIRTKNTASTLLLAMVTMAITGARREGSISECPKVLQSSYSMKIIRSMPSNGRCRLILPVNMAWQTSGFSQSWFLMITWWVISWQRTKLQGCLLNAFLCSMTIGCIPNISYLFPFCKRHNSWEGLAWHNHSLLSRVSWNENVK